MATVINVTFKNDDKEMKLYTEANSHSGKVGWVKDCIKFYMDYGQFEKKLKVMLSNENRKEQ